MKYLSLTAASVAIMLGLGSASQAQNYNADQIRNTFQYTNANQGNGQGESSQGYNQGGQGGSNQGGSFGQGGQGFFGGGTNWADQQVISGVRQLQNYEQRLQGNIEQLKTTINQGDPYGTRSSLYSVATDEQSIRQLSQQIDQLTNYASPSVQRDVAIIRGSQQLVRNGYQSLKNDMRNLSYTGMAFDSAAIQRAWQNLAQDEQRLQQNALYGGNQYPNTNRYMLQAGGFGSGVVSVAKRNAILRR
ncbi:MAG: hypothetical protein PHW76_05420 [Alphaproteobacteria bacterium]|nr:hypothetical protein [Alphaproteobacteria bacterium]